MENVRITGIVVAVLFAAYGIFRYRGGGRRFDLFLALLIAAGVAVVSVVPQIGQVFVDLFGLQNRAFALLSFAVLLLLALFLYLLGQVRIAGRRSRQMVTGMAARQYAERYALQDGIAAGENKSRGKVLIIVPAYNEEGGILDVLNRVPKDLLGYEVKTVIVDDGSVDRTEEIALEAGFPVAAHAVNLGQGDALRTGFEIARLERADIVTNLDADGQYKPEEMEKLIRPIVEGEADFVLGSRFLGYYEESGSIRHIGVVFFSKMISILTRTSISDCTNGFRAIRVSMLHKMDLVEDRFNATEIILEALKNGLRFHEVPISMLKRAAGETKKPPRLAYPFGVFRVIIQTWLR